MSPISDNELEQELTIRGVRVYSTSQYKISVPISECSNLKTAETTALIDCGAEGKFIDSSIVDWTKVEALQKPLPVRNVDGTLNKAGSL